MEIIYKAYTREINGKTFYFVKKFSVFPEYDNYPAVLDAMGMHTNFYKACNIAHVEDDRALNKLISELPVKPETYRNVHMPKMRSITHSFLKNTQHALLKFRLAPLH